MKIKNSKPINNARYDPLENVKIRLIRDIKSKEYLSYFQINNFYSCQNLINL